MYKQMEDKRITKTKRNIKATLISLLQDTPFEKITVAALCRRGETSRITFYTYYEDKYALVDEMSADFIREADVDYHRLQRENNPEGDGLVGYGNLLECILNLYYNNIDFFSHATPEDNPYLFSVFYRHILQNVDEYLRRHDSLVCKYSTKETAALLCNGLWGVITECYYMHKSADELRRSVKAIYNDLLHSSLFKMR